MKAYIVGSPKQERREGGPHIEIEFDGRRENASSWPTRQEAERNCAVYNGYPRIESAGGRHVYRNFSVEERAEDQFVVVCECSERS
jgi:hypothetical protein